MRHSGPDDGGRQGEEAAVRDELWRDDEVATLRYGLAQGCTYEEIALAGAAGGAMRDYGRRVVGVGAAGDMACEGFDGGEGDGR